MIASSILVLAGVICLGSAGLIHAVVQPGRSVTHILGWLGPVLLVVGGLTFLMDAVRSGKRPDREQDRTDA